MYLELTKMALSGIIVEAALLAVIYWAFNPPMTARWVRTWIWVAIGLSMIRARATISGAEPSWWGAILWWHVVVAAAALIVATFDAAIEHDRRQRGHRPHE